MRSVDDLDTMFDSLGDLTLQQRAAIKERYRFLMAEYSWRCRFYTVLFYVLRTTMTVGSLAVPAMLSLNNLEDQAAKGLYWGTWGLSLAVTTANGLLTLFKLDKRFFMLHAVAEKLRSETWQYLTLSGRYSGHYGGLRPTHRNQYVYYTYKIEKIRMQHINDEYVRPAGDADDKKVVAAPSTNSRGREDGDGGDGGHHGSVSQDVPTPPDQALLRSGTTPGPRGPLQTTVKYRIGRQDSSDTIGKGDEIALEIHEKKDEKGPSATEGGAVSVHNGDGSAVSPSGRRRNSVLFATPEV
jgi:hypothetical protein